MTESNVHRVARRRENLKTTCANAMNAKKSSVVYASIKSTKITKVENVALK